MNDNESSCYLSKIKQILLKYLFFSFPLIENKSLTLKYFNFVDNQNILLQKQTWLSAFLLSNFIGKLVMTYVIFKSIWCMILRHIVVILRCRLQYRKYFPSF